MIVEVRSTLLDLLQNSDSQRSGQDNCRSTSRLTDLTGGQLSTNEGGLAFQTSVPQWFLALDLGSLRTGEVETSGPPLTQEFFNLLTMNAPLVIYDHNRLDDVTLTRSKGLPADISRQAIQLFVDDYRNLPRINARPIDWGLPVSWLDYEEVRSIDQREKKKLVGFPGRTYSFEELGSNQNGFESLLPLMDKMAQTEGDENVRLVFWVY